MSSSDRPSTGQESTWGGWLSSVATIAYESVVGSETPLTPETFEGLTPTTTLTNGEQGTNEFSDVDNATRQALWKQLVSLIGMDVMNMRLSLPIWLFEPSTALTRMCETFQFSDILDRAAAESDPVLRDSLVAAFVISAFAHTERVRKPFNPVLGETFAHSDNDGKMRFFAEQVSHHPPISVSKCDGKGWSAGETVDIVATYLGNSVEICNTGPQATRYINLTNSGDQYTWNLPKAVVSNLFIGGTFIDHYGTIELVNQKTKSKSVLTLKKCGWFSAGRYEVHGELFSDGTELVGTYSGQWNKFFDFERASRGHGEGAMRLWAAGKHLLPEEDGGGSTGTLPKFTKFGASFFRVSDDFKETILPSDSRLRPDRLALEQGDSILASDEKLKVEQAQRDRLKALKDEGVAHEATWFYRVNDDEGERWEVKANFWEEVKTNLHKDRQCGKLW